MVDQNKISDQTFSNLKGVLDAQGSDAACETAKHMIAAATAFIAHERGPDEARRLLRTIGEAQGRSA
jgi:hypothetical protein